MSTNKITESTSGSALKATSQSSTHTVTASSNRLRSPSSHLKSVSHLSLSRRKRRKVRKNKDEHDFNRVPGVAKLILSQETQQTMELVVDEDVTSEQPWKYVPKYKIDYDIEIKEGKSDFDFLKKEILKYEDSEMLLGYVSVGTTDYDLFYICLTDEAVKEVSSIIEELKRIQEQKLQDTVNKTARKWKSLGSEAELNDMVFVSSRSLFEVEVESEYPIMATKAEFRLRLVENAVDGYVELLPGRNVYTNVIRKQLHADSQIKPPVVEKETQTVCTYPRNMWTQYKYEYDIDATMNLKFTQTLKSFLDNKMKSVNDMLYVGGDINFYTFDYKKLVLDPRSTMLLDFSSLKEYTFMLDEELCKGKQITSLSWHCLWTGVVACAYSEEAQNIYRKNKPTKDVITEAIHNVIPVLVWSFKDSLKPRLYLQTPREVSVVAFCPFNENILVGGCVNGQVIIWDITNKLEGVEVFEPLTVEQQKYRVLMGSLMRWAKNVKDPKVVQYTAVSDLQYSHRSTVSSIKWLSPFRELTRNGKIEEIPEEESRTSLQFMSVSKDGTILTWDLLAKPVTASGSIRPRKKLKRLKERPAALNVDVSPFRALNRVFKPVFKINVLEPNTNRPFPLASLSIRRTPNLTREKYPNPNRKFDITERIYYKPLFNRPTHPLSSSVLLGTAEGDFIVGSWEGFEFNTGEVVSQEHMKIENYGKYHDGPIVSVSRSESFPDLALTVGGKIFALWISGFIGKPVFWKRSRHRYTSGTWHTFRPWVFKLTRDDGYIETWELQVRSDQYEAKVFISGLSLSGSVTHPLPLKNNITGIPDSASNLRLFFIAKYKSYNNPEDKASTYNFCMREAKRKTIFLKWQQDWTTKHADWIQEKNRQAGLVKQQAEEINELEKEKSKQHAEILLEEEKTRQKPVSTHEPGKYKEWANEQLMIREKKRMNAVLLSKRALDINLLEKQQIPLLKEIKLEEEKKIKQAKRLQNAPKMLEDEVAMLFPDVVKKPKPPPPDPYGGGEPLDTKLKYFAEYEDTARICKEYVSHNPYVNRFDWIEVLQTGKERHKLLTSGFKNGHKSRLQREKENGVQSKNKIEEDRSSEGGSETRLSSSSEEPSAENLI